MEELYLVTGAAGHLGNTLVRKLLALDKNIRCLVLPEETNLPDGDLEIYYGDICDKESLFAFFDNPENKSLIVIHCAGIVSIASKYQQKVYDINVTGTKNIVDLCQQYKVKKLIYVSSVHAIPEKAKGETIVEISDFNPDDVVGLYAKTKSQATNYVLLASKKGLNASVVHPSGILGPFDYGHGHMNTLVIDYYKGRLTAGIKGGFDFVDVRDVADGIITCSEKGGIGECYLLTNKRFSIKEMLNLLHEITGKKKIKIFLPLWFVKLTALAAETYYKIRKQTPLFTSYSIYTLSTNALYSNAKAKAELNYTNRDIKETLQDTINWLHKKQKI